MGTEIFRFVTVRPPQEVPDPRAAAETSIDLGAITTGFLRTLRALRRDGGYPAMVAAATDLVASDSFIGAADRLTAAYLDFLAAVATLSEDGFWTALEHAFSEAFDTTPGDYVDTEEFRETYARSVDSIVAAAIDQDVTSTARGLLVRLARALWLIRRLADGMQLGRAAAMSAPLLLPTAIFPLPQPPAVDAPPPPGPAGQALELRREDAARVTADLTAQRTAVVELVDAVGRGEVRFQRDETGGVLALSDAGRQGLSDSTRALLDGIGQRVDVIRAVSLLEQRSTALARRLGGTGVLDAQTGTPGPCTPAGEPPPNPAVTVPATHGDARVLGIADLMVVEQNLARYELGELSHIENVLRSESRKRTFKTSHTLEQSTTTEVETTQVKEQDLSSTERFELTTESQSVINETAAKSLGLTVHASYGPSVDATSTVNLSSGTSRQQSAVTSASFAREVTTKASQRIQTRTLTQRTVRTVDVVEESSEHGFDNTAGDTDVIGLYRFVDKIYTAQVVSYGKRLMLEFVVPEPAAFLRYARSSRPADSVTVPKPEEPGYCVAGSFVPLRPEDITADNYLLWAGKYGASDVKSPPSPVTVASGTKRSPDSMGTISADGERKISSDLFDITIPPGYLCNVAVLNVYGETQAGKHVVMLQIQEQQMTYIEPDDDAITLTLEPAPVLSVSVNTVGFHNYEVIATVVCIVAPETFADWQLATFSSVMNAYGEARSRYDQAVAEARFAAQDAASGTSPAENRQTEQLELRKACVAQLTGQRFDLFDAVGRNRPPLGYPEVDFAEASAEGAYIQAIEGGFEWTNVIYVFHPYFWGRKKDWPATVQLTDADPLFARFLQAGAARVQVPVRLGFEAGVLNYLATGQLWDADGTFVNNTGPGPDPVHLSVLDELRSQLGDNTVPGPGTVAVTTNSTAVTGAGTAFGLDDGNRRIVIAGRTYLIDHVQDEHTVTLSTPYQGESRSGLAYSFGGRLVGEPWELRLPTDLVMLDNSLVIH